MRTAAPLLASGAKMLGKQLLKSGVSVARDVASGKKPSRALKARAREAGSLLLGQVAQQGKGRVANKRKITNNKVLYAKRKRTRTKKDIFT